MKKDKLPLHMTPEEFRENGHALINWIVDYMEHVGEYPVLPEVEPDTRRGGTPCPLPPDHWPITAT